MIETSRGGSVRAMNGGTQGSQALCWSQGGCGQGEEALSARN